MSSVAPEQLRLVTDADCWRAVDVARLRTERERLHQATRAPRTVAEYRKDWEHQKLVRGGGARLTGHAGEHKVSTLRWRLVGVGDVDRLRCG